MRYSTLLPAAALFETSIAGYVLQDDYMNDFFGGFDFFTGPDPTEGFVDFVDEGTARQTNLINSTSKSSVQWGVDTENRTPNGRPSVRIASKKSYDSGLIVLDVAHMPFGCGTWPAFWTVGPDWPHNGEIDILEGVHVQTNNGMTLHTGPGCQIGQDTTQFTGSVHSGNCDVNAQGQPQNTGCSIGDPWTSSYGAGLNAIGGGVFATQWTGDAISIFYFPRGSIPEDVLGDNPNPSGWGKPTAKFSGGCDIAQTFKQQRIVFDTTFCGQWAGSPGVWGSSSCSAKAATCVEYVRDNPEAFTEAYWTINALKVYQDNGEAYSPPASSPPYRGGASSALDSSPSMASSSGLLVSSQYAAVPTDSNTAVPTEASYTEDAASSASPTKPAAQAPTGAEGMPGFKWPEGKPNSGASYGGLPSRATNITQPSKPPLPHPPAPAPNASSVVPPANPDAQTVYRTIYATVTEYPAATPSPAGPKVRMSRHMREHRQRLTRHNARA